MSGASNMTKTTGDNLMFMITKIIVIILLLLL